LADGYRVTGIDDLSSGKQENLPPDFDLRVMDIRSTDVHNVITEIQPDLVLHLAAQISVSVSVREPQIDADINLGGSINLLEGIRVSEIENVRVVYVTSGGTAYGEPKIIPADEFTPLRPLSPYGASKLGVENYLPVYERICGMSYAVMRLANIYGPRQDPHGEAGVVAIFSKAMLSDCSLTVFGDGNDQRDYTFVVDCVEAIVQAANSSLPGPFNVGTGIATSTNQIFELIAENCGHNKPALHGPAREGDINRITLDSKRAADQLGWIPKVSLEEGLKITVDWFKQHLD
jgi:UDP-glucose 4-epimerase